MLTYNILWFFIFRTGKLTATIFTSFRSVACLNLFLLVEVKLHDFIVFASFKMNRVKRIV